MLLRNLPSGTKKKVLKELRTVVPEDNDWLHWWVLTYLGIWIPNEKVCADHDAPFTAFADAFFGRANVVVCHGSRLFGGKTFLAGLLATVRMILRGAEIYILGGSKDQTNQMREYIKGTSEHTRDIWWNWKRAPRGMLTDVTNDTVKLSNGGRTTALAASQKETRSKHGTDLYVDEADELEWDVFKSALGQTYKGTRNINPLTFVTSTWQNPEGTMSQIFEQAEEKGWSVYTWCYRETHEEYGGHVTQAEIDRKKSEMTTLDWMNEVELSRPESGDLIFDPETIEGLFVPTYGKFTDKVGYDYVFFTPDPRFDFSHGTDWAKERDFTVITSFVESRSGPDLLAAWCMRQKEPWPTMIEHHNRRVREYGGPSILDATGIGNVIKDFVTVPHEGWEFSNRKKTHEMYSNFIVACESGEYALPEIPYLKKKFETLTRAQVYEAKRGSKKNHTPDPFVSAAMARQAKMAGSFELLLEEM